MFCRNHDKEEFEDVCEQEVNKKDPRRKSLDPYINECTQCCEWREDNFGKKAIPYLAVKSASGKMANITILKFDSMQDRSQYHQNWKKNSNQGYRTSLKRAGNTSGIKFETVGENFANMNHKGKV